MNPAVFKITSLSSTLNVPAWATAAPAKPPIRVCDELEGIPNHQVSKFQNTAATSPAITTIRFIAPGSITVLATVSATFRSKIQKATTLKKAAQTTA